MNDAIQPLSRSEYTILALAGVTQASVLVHATAYGRPVDTTAREALLAAVTTHRARRLEDVFVSPASFRQGLRTLQQALSGDQIAPEVARYTLRLLELARRLRRSPRVTAQLGKLLDELTEGSTDTQALALVYQRTISTLGKRIQVTGDPNQLQQQGVSDGIRSQLLAGVRFAWLWEQLGGRRWHLVLRRNALLLALQSLMRKL